MKKKTLSKLSVPLLVLYSFCIACNDSSSDDAESKEEEPKGELPTQSDSSLEVDASPLLDSGAETEPPSSELPDTPYLGAAGIGVSSLELSTDFYTRVLGMTVTYELEMEGFMNEVLLQFEGGQKSAVVLMHYTDGSERNYTDVPAKLVFAVPDAASFAKAIADEGLPILAEPRPFEELNGVVIGMAKDPDGYLIEIIEDPNTTIPYLGGVGIGVSDLESSTDFYTRVIGLTEQYSLSIEEMDETIFESESGRGSSVVLMHYTNEKNYKDNPVKLVFYVPNPTEFAQGIRDEGLPIPLEPAPLEDFNGAIVGFGKDLDGYLIEILETP